ncbi:MAG: hypothetical protein AAF098_18920, partial [Pseudomonadota bacterium]
MLKYFPSIPDHYDYRVICAQNLQECEYPIEKTGTINAKLVFGSKQERWSPFSEQSGGLATLEPVLLYAASSVPPRPVWASKGVRP